MQTNSRPSRRHHGRKAKPASAGCHALQPAIDRWVSMLHADTTVEICFSRWSCAATSCGELQPAINRWAIMPHGQPLKLKVIMALQLAAVDERLVSIKASQILARSRFMAVTCCPLISRILFRCGKILDGREANPAQGCDRKAS